MKVYLAAQYEYRKTLRPLAEAMQLLGHTVTSNWIWSEATRAQEEGDPALARDVACKNVQDLQEADTLLVFTDRVGDRAVGGGRFFELGLAWAYGHEIIVIGEPEMVFHHLPDITFYPTYREFAKEHLRARV